MNVISFQDVSLFSLNLQSHLITSFLLSSGNLQYVPLTTPTSFTRLKYTQHHYGKLKSAMLQHLIAVKLIMHIKLNLGCNALTHLEAFGCSFVFVTTTKTPLHGSIVNPFLMVRM